MEPILNIEQERRRQINLRKQARVLGVKNINSLSLRDLEDKVKIMLRVRREGLTRLEFDDEKQIVPSVENLRILSIEADEKMTSLSKYDILDKLENYRVLEDRYNTTPKRWTRYINRFDGLLRAGGFPIRNNRDEEFIVMKNVSKKFTFSIKRSEVILFQHKGKNPIDLSQPAKAVVSKFNQKTGNTGMYVAVSQDFKSINGAMSLAALSRLIDGSKGGLTKAFKAGNNVYKNFFIFRLSNEDFELLKTDIGELSEEDREPSGEDFELVNQYVNIWYPDDQD